MKRITIYDWNIGFHKIAFSKLLRKHFGYELLQAKAATDGLLGRQAVNLEVADDMIEQLVSELNQIGAKFETGEAGATE